MGAWSPTILGNDTSCEVRERFFEIHDLGEQPENIAEIVLEEQKENLQYDGNNVWFGLALAAWECKVLTSEIFNQVKQIVESKADIEFNKELQADNDFLKKRQKVLDNFIAKLSTEKEKARARKKIPIQIESVYLSGMCFTYKNANGKYVGIYLTKSEHFKNNGKIVFCFMDFESDEIPNLSMFSKSKLYGLNKLGPEWNGYEYQGNVTDLAYEKKTKDDFYNLIPKALILVGQLKGAAGNKLINNYRGRRMNLADLTNTIETLELIRHENKSEYKLSEMTLGKLLDKIGIN